MADNNGEVEEVTWKSAVEAGWSSEQFLEAFADTMRTLLTNYFNRLVHTEQDVPEAPEL